PRRKGSSLSIPICQNTAMSAGQRVEIRRVISWSLLGQINVRRATVTAFCGSVPNTIASNESVPNRGSAVREATWTPPCLESRPEKRSNNFIQHPFGIHAYRAHLATLDSLTRP